MDNWTEFEKVTLLALGLCFFVVIRLVIFCGRK